MTNRGEPAEALTSAGRFGVFSINDDCEECATLRRKCPFCRADEKRNKPEERVEMLLDAMDSMVDRFNESEAA